MLKNEEEYPYIGIEEPQGGIRIEGPLSEENAKRKQKKSIHPITVTRAKTKGAAILKLIITSLNADKSKPKSSK